MANQSLDFKELEYSTLGYIYREPYYLIIKGVNVKLKETQSEYEAN
jgi:hypothetical protein